MSRSSRRLCSQEPRHEPVPPHRRSSPVLARFCRVAGSPLACSRLAAGASVPSLRSRRAAPGAAARPYTVTPSDRAARPSHACHRVRVPSGVPTASGQLPERSNGPVWNAGSRARLDSRVRISHCPPSLFAIASKGASASRHVRDMTIMGACVSRWRHTIPETERLRKWTRSSGVEHTLDKRGVGGSKPPGSTRSCHR